MSDRSASLTAAVRDAAHPLQDVTGDYDPLIDAIGDSRFVLLGEASHGTHEFYAARQAITQRLIAERGFCAVVAEADWPDAWRICQYVRDRPDGETKVASADDALSGFRRFPHWMWRNTDVRAFVEWLRAYNDARPSNAHKPGFYGMDLYSLHGSIAQVLEYLERVDPQAAQRARERYGCFGDYGHDPQAYGRSAGFRMRESCEDDVVQQLIDLRQQAGDYATRAGCCAEDEFFYAEQNARLIKNAEHYYRAMFDEYGVDTWNLRDTHMLETIAALDAHLTQQTGRPAKMVVWAHNSHLGDARATDSALQDQLNVGQLVRERWGEQTFLVGFSTHDGTVTAASNWDGPSHRKRVRPSLAESYERVFHDAAIDRFLLLLRPATDARHLLMEERLQRAIGVIYRPETERMSHYFHARLPEQFDAILHFDRTTAVRPLEIAPTWASADVDDTYPSGL